MNPAEILRAMEHYKFTVFGPPRSGVPEDRKWHARDEAGGRQGWGSTPAEAIENAVAVEERTTEQCEPQPEPEEWDFLN